MTAAFEPSFVERFWRTVDIRGDDECWPWLGTRRASGYGTIHHDGKGKPAHRVSWCIANNQDWPIGQDGRHSCDNPPCVNPRHMTPGTRKENVHDMIERNRDGGIARHHREKTHCINGHEFSEVNTHIFIKRGRPTRTCIMCRRAQTKAYKVRKKAREAAGARQTGAGA